MESVRFNSDSMVRGVRDDVGGLVLVIVMVYVWFMWEFLICNIEDDFFFWKKILEKVCM